MEKAKKKIDFKKIALGALLTILAIVVILCIAIWLHNEHYGEKEAFLVRPH